MSEAELENFILKYLSTKKFSKSQKLFSQELSRKRKTSNNFILEERFEKLQKYFFNVKENDNTTSKSINDQSSDDTDFEEIENLVQNSKYQSRNGIQNGPFCCPFRDGQLLHREQSHNSSFNPS